MDSFAETGAALGKVFEAGDPLKQALATPPQDFELGRKTGKPAVIFGHANTVVFKPIGGLACVVGADFAFMNGPLRHDPGNRLS